MSSTSQPKSLHVDQPRQIQRLGDAHPRPTALTVDREAVVNALTELARAAITTMINRIESRLR